MGDGFVMVVMGQAPGKGCGNTPVLNAIHWEALSGNVARYAWQGWMVMGMVNEMRLIDANALMAVIEREECNCEVFPWAINNAPTVDAVEVVRCKNCARALDLGHSDHVLCRGRKVTGNSWCSDGVRLQK